MCQTGDWKDDQLMCRRKRVSGSRKETERKKQENSENVRKLTYEYRIVIGRIGQTSVAAFQ